jgi:lipoprotein signal peptidase
MILRLTLIAAGATALAALDLAVKAILTTPPELLHERSTAWISASLFLLCACLASALLRSALTTVAAAACAGGLLGNLASALTGDQQVPDPFLFGGPTHGVVFNLADAFFVCGLAAFAVAALRKPVRLLGSS